MVALPRSLVMLDREGKVLWAATPPGRVWMDPPSVLDDGTVAVVFQRELEDAEKQREFDHGPIELVYVRYNDDGRLLCERAAGATFPSVLWSRALSANAVLQSADGGWLLADNNLLYLLDEQGAERWKRFLPFPITHIAVVDEGRAYVLTTRKLHGLSLREGGQFLWERDCGDSSVLQVAPNGTAYFVDRGRTTRPGSVTLVALDIQGREVWRHRVAGGSPSTLLVGAASAAFALPNGILYSREGHVLWEGSTLCPEGDVRLSSWFPDSAAAVDEGRFWLRLERTGLVLLGEDGMEGFRSEVPETPLLPPAMARDGSVCVADVRGGLSLYSCEGRRLWRITAGQVQDFISRQAVSARQD